MLNIYLPGYSTHNAEFGHKLSKRFLRKKWQVYVRSWQHWKTESKLDYAQKIEFEAHQLDRVLSKFQKTAKGVVAKSFGIQVLAHYLQVQPANLEYLILMGIPFAEQDLESKQLEEFIHTFNQIQTKEMHIFQNDGDNVAAPLVSRQIAQELNANYVVKEAEGHSYEHLDEITAIAKQYNQIST